MRIEPAKLGAKSVERLPRLRLRFAREEIDRHQVLEGSLQALRRGLGLALSEADERGLCRVDPADKLAVLTSAIEELPRVVTLAGVAVIEKSPLTTSVTLTEWESEPLVPVIVMAIYLVVAKRLGAFEAL